MSKTNTRQIGLPGYELGDYIKESIDFIRRHEPPEGYFVGFSGGKDSIVTLELCRMAGVKHEAYFSCTRIDPPEMYRFIKAHYPDVKWLMPKESFWKLIVRKQPPFRHIRWCCDKLKKEPSKKIPLSSRIMGIRSEESPKRASFPRVDYIARHKQTVFKPIFLWPEWAIWEFIEAYKLPYPELYDEGFGRIGCTICPFIFNASEAAQRKIAAYQAKWPAQWKCFKIACRKWFERTAANGLREGQRCKNFDQFWYLYLRGGVLMKKMVGKENRYCSVCGNPLPEGSKHNRLYCSHECQLFSRRKAYKKRYVPREPVNKICAICGKMFFSQGKGSAVYCSDACRRMANTIQHRSYYERKYGHMKDCVNRCGHKVQKVSGYEVCIYCDRKALKAKSA